jgi:hypothetical protein
MATSRGSWTGCTSPPSLCPLLNTRTTIGPQSNHHPDHDGQPQEHHTVSHRSTALTSYSPRTMNLTTSPLALPEPKAPTLPVSELLAPLDSDMPRQSIIHGPLRGAAAAHDSKPACYRPVMVSRVVRKLSPADRSPACIGSKRPHEQEPTWFGISRKAQAAGALDGGSCRFCLLKGRLWGPPRAE